MDIPDKLSFAKLILPYMPFVGAMVKQADGKVHTPMVTRLIEVAFLGGIIYGSLSGQLSNMAKEITAIQVSQKEMQKDIVDVKVDVATIKGARK